ncbi:MAG: hypothetical protein HUU01_02690 [Saprospiraceae bacterium]|nr:hypothetical protein [Saprospiraceae bacterium]
MQLRYLYSSLLAAFLCFAASAQEQLGLRVHAFAGINGALLNPAAPATSPFAWDVNLVEGAFFFANNYAFIRDSRILDLVRARESAEFFSAPDFPDDAELPENGFLVDFFSDGRKQFANMLSSFTGPSFFFRIGEAHTIGLVTRARFMATGNGISDNLSYFIYEDRPFFEEFVVEPFRMGFMGWSEYGLNYTYAAETEAGKLSIGATLRYLQGYEGAYLRSREAFDLTKLPGRTLSGTPFDFGLGYSRGLLEAESYELQRNGRGFAADLGFTYTIGEEEGAYDWKIGVSLLDLGGIRFNGAQHRIQTPDIRSVTAADYDDIRSASEFENKLRVFSAQTLSDSSASFQGNAFTMSLPTAFSLQLDRAFSEKFAVNATYVQGVPVGAAGVQRGAMLALTPHFGNRWFGAAIPVSLYNWQQLRLGLSVRLAFLTIGSDQIGSIFSRRDLSGTDFYFALKVNPFKIRSSEKEHKKGYSRGGAKRMKAGNAKVKCYDW